ncbi:hypothetical protein CBOM_03585 [Ceraceosorus bombacis]|uniref:Uncharacterized protein n=1 Tax=Ceraceosorus bombacis TaxID=401625 RepID=A0A0P1BGG0_9BASI|nr:hypothetical protein CBOM_03585 [Ceraceosorus bombacis]
MAPLLNLPSVLPSPGPSPLLPRSLPASPAPGAPIDQFLPRDVPPRAIGQVDAVKKRTPKAGGKGQKRRWQKSAKSRKLAARLQQLPSSASLESRAQTLVVEPESLLEAKGNVELLLNAPPARRHPLKLSEGGEAVDEFLEDRSLENAVVDERSGFISVEHHEPQSPRSVFQSFVDVLGTRALRLYERGYDGQPALDVPLQSREIDEASKKPSRAQRRRRGLQQNDPFLLQPSVSDPTSEKKGDQCSKLHKRTLEAHKIKIRSASGHDADLLGRKQGDRIALNKGYRKVE